MNFYKGIDRMNLYWLTTVFDILVDIAWEH